MCPAIFSIIESSDNVHKADIDRPGSLHYKIEATAGTMGDMEPLSSK